MSDNIDAPPRSRYPALLGASPEATLGSAFLEAVRHVLQDELKATLKAERTPRRSPWMTPPAAARASGVPVKSIRAWVHSGRISKRLKNRCAEPKQLKYLVNLNEVVAAAEQWSAASNDGPGESMVLEDRARQILAERAARGR